VTFGIFFAFDFSVSLTHVRARQQHRPALRKLGAIETGELEVKFATLVVLRKLWAFTGTLSVWGCYGPCYALCDYIERRCDLSAIAVEEVTGIA
jgi:hypothetical protein